MSGGPMGPAGGPYRVELTAVIKSPPTPFVEALQEVCDRFDDVAVEITWPSDSEL